MIEKDILIVEDEPAIARLMEIHLCKAGFTVACCGNGDESIILLQQNRYRLLILDRMIPGKRGMDILRWLRKQDEISSLPVLMVTALGSTDEKVRGLNEGADDYLAKPFEPEELIARAQALLRRSVGSSSDNFDVATIELDADAMEVRVKGQVLALRPLEFRLMQVFVEKSGKVRSREYLLDRAWGVNSFVEIRTVDVTVKRLRKALAEYGLEDCIQTVRGAGYRFMMPKKAG
ncbi:MAG: response regulator [Mariprofundaceae bacterium]